MSTVELNSRSSKFSKMIAPSNPVPISVSPSWEGFTRRQVSNRHPTLTCCFTSLSCSTSYRRTRSTLGILRSSSFVQGASRSRGQELRTPATSFQSSEIRCAAGRRHHRRRDDEHEAYLRSKEKPKGPEKVQFKPSKRGGTDDKVVITLDMDELKHRAAETVVVAKSVAERAVVAALRAAERSVDTVVQSAKAAALESGDVWRELRTSVRVQRDKHLVISIRRSSLEFVGRAVVGSILLVVFAKLLLAAMRKYQWGWEEGFSRLNRVVRDRSLGGKEVTLNKGLKRWEGGSVRKAVNVRRDLRGPLGTPLEDSRAEKEMLRIARARGDGVPAAKKTPRLPGWWPDSDLPPSASISGRQRAKEEARRLVQGIMQKRLSGLDFSAGDILQLRQLCKAAGDSVKFDTYNTRDAFYRAAINIVLSACQRASKWSTVEFGSEGGVRFIAGLASNIGLESDRAATMVNAAVAVRTRAGLLQARALRMQSKSAESEEELLKLVRLHSCFRPDPNSAEMEMVAQSLGSHFDREGRIEMLQMYENLGGAETKRVAEEALGLLLTS